MINRKIVVLTEWELKHLSRAMTEYHNRIQKEQYELSRSDPLAWDRDTWNLDALSFRINWLYGLVKDRQPLSLSRGWRWFIDAVKGKHNAKSITGTGC